VRSPPALTTLRGPPSGARAPRLGIKPWRRPPRPERPPAPSDTHRRRSQSAHRPKSPQSAIAFASSQSHNSALFACSSRATWHARGRIREHVCSAQHVKCRRADEDRRHRAAAARLANPHARPANRRCSMRTPCSGTITASDPQAALTAASSERQAGSSTTPSPMPRSGNTTAATTTV
jgi:hypothetical protein